MLVLSRKKGESLSVGQEITIEILSVDGDRVRIGIQAPREVRIIRKELLEETVNINKIAVSTPAVNFMLGSQKKEPDA